MNNEQLKNIWMDTVAGLGANGAADWEQISAQYTGSGRHYHTLQHLGHMYEQLAAYYGKHIPVATLLALFYHDYEYSPLRGDNEARSAGYAEQRLLQWKADSNLITKVVLLINETWQHAYRGADNELKIFLDADMAILGADVTTYKAYTEAVRKEYNVFPDILYNKGRRDFIKKTLAEAHVYHSEFFRARLEQQARINLQTELNALL